MRLAVTGKTGQVMTALLERGAVAGVEVIALGRPEFDLGQDQSMLDALEAVSPDVIVSAAAYTAVDKAETESELAQAVNGRGPGLVAAAAAALNVPVIHLSTDYVFNGSKATPYVETDATGPLGVYGSSKLAGEAAVAAATPNHVILRTAWVYSPFGQNFLKTMLRLAADRPELRVVDDQRGNPTSALDIADAVLAIARNLLDRPDDAALRGVFHLAGTGEASWADFAIEIFAASAALGGASSAVSRITTADYPTPARRPANSRLSSAKLQQIHGVTMPHWTSSTRSVVERLVAIPA
jgi:dTDP-4-dehydrorhamnose reductase